eukprot:COSAG01_NODE_4683_length_4818_cov_2.240305_4_plen_137_part_00
MAFADTHEPVEAPAIYVDKYPDTMPPCRRTYNGMASAVDDAVKNITAALHSSGLWNSSLVVFSSDNVSCPHACMPGRWVRCDDILTHKWACRVVHRWSQAPAAREFCPPSLVVSDSPLSGSMPSRISDRLNKTARR